MSRQLTLVTWLDAWQDQENFASAHGISLSHKPMLVTTLGWLIVDDDEGLSVVNERSIDESGTEVFRGRTFIPRLMIKDIEAFNLTKRRKKAIPSPPLDDPKLE